MSRSAQGCADRRSGRVTRHSEKAAAQRPNGISYDKRARVRNPHEPVVADSDFRASWSENGYL